MDNAHDLSALLLPDDLESLREYLLAQPSQSALREELFALFLQVVAYEDATQWATAVRICEALAIAGWGQRERVDARSHFNGDCWNTFFITGTGEQRYRFGRWSKRKAGWVLFNPEDYFSPDLPAKPARSWREHSGVAFRTVDAPHLASQRNYQKPMPIVMGFVGGGGVLSDRVLALSRQLTALLIREMRPSIYGDAVEHFYLTLYCPGPGLSSSPGLKIGAYDSRRRAFTCKLSIASGFERLQPGEQQAVFIVAFETAVAALKTKLLKKALSYDIDAFLSDIRAAFRSWRPASTETLGYDPGV